MTEADWLAATDPVPMLAHLDALRLTSLRKARLLRVAAARSVWTELADERWRAAVEVAESYADGKCDESEVVRHQKVLYGRYMTRGGGTWPGELDDPHHCMAQACVNGDKLVAMLSGGSAWRGYSVPHTSRQLPALILDLYGNPFRPAPPTDPRWLSAAAIDLAHAIYDGRAFDRMPELAGALEAAGCDSAELLAHCRGAGPHARGCWALDLVLGRR